MDSSALLGNLINYTWDYYLISFLVTVLGVVSHYVKKCVQEKLDWIKYWTTNKGNSILVILSVLSSYFGILLVDPNPSLMTFISISYMLDSILNKDGGARHDRRQERGPATGGRQYRDARSYPQQGRPHINESFGEEFDAEPRHDGEPKF